MNSTDFTQKNMTLRAGGNKNTVGLPVALATNRHIPEVDFFVSKWELDVNEKKAYIDMLQDTFRHVGLEFKPGQEAELIIKLGQHLPAIYLSAMHTPPPVIMTAYNPFEQGYYVDDIPREGFMLPNDDKAARINKPNAHPDEN